MNLKVLVLSCLFAALAVSSTTIEKSLMDDLNAFIDSSDLRVSAQDILSAENEAKASNAEEDNSTFIETSAVQQQSANGEVTDTSILMAMRDVLPAVVAAEKVDLDSIFHSNEHPAFEITSFLEMDNEVDEEEQDAAFLSAEEEPAAASGNGYQADGWMGPIISGNSFEGRLLTRGHYYGYPHPAERIFGNADYYGTTAHPAFYSVPVVRSFGIGPTPGGYATSADMGRSFMEVDADEEAEEEVELADEPFDWGDFNGSENVDREVTTPGGSGTDTPTTPTVPPTEPEVPPTPPTAPEVPPTPPVTPPPVTNTTNPEPPVTNTTKPEVPVTNTTNPVICPPVTVAPPVKKQYEFVPHVEYKLKKLRARFYPYYSRENGYNSDRSEAWNEKHAPKMDGAVIYQEPEYDYDWYWDHDSRIAKPLSREYKEKYIFTHDTPELPRLFPANMDNAKEIEPIHREIVVGMLNNRVRHGAKHINRVRDLTRVVNKMDNIQFPVETIQQYKD